MGRDFLLLIDLKYQKNVPIWFTLDRFPPLRSFKLQRRKELRLKVLLRRDDLLILCLFIYYLFRLSMKKSSRKCLNDPQKSNPLVLSLLLLPLLPLLPPLLLRPPLPPLLPLQEKDPTLFLKPKIPTSNNKKDKKNHLSRKIH